MTSTSSTQTTNENEGKVLPPQFQSYEEYCLTILQFLHKYSFLFDFTTGEQKLSENVEEEGEEGEDKAIHFFIQKHWEAKIPLEWREFLTPSRVSLQEALLLQSKGLTEEQEKTWPPSLVEYIKLAHALRLRNNIPFDESAYDALNSHQRGKRKQPEKEDLTSIVLKHMKSKKKYEIKRLGKAILEYARHSKCNTIVDIGAGQGYLSQYLAFLQQQENLEAQEKKPIMTVVAIDGDRLQTERSQKRVENIQQGIIATTSTESESATATSTTSASVATAVASAEIHNVTAHLALNISHEEFLQVLRPYLSKQNTTESQGTSANTTISSQEEEERRILMIGLHTCGDLAPTMLKIFLQTDSEALVNVGCCYQKLTDCIGESKISVVGYPMSDLVKKNAKFNISTGKWLACYAPAMWDNHEDTMHQFKMQSFRAALESYIYEQIKPPILESHKTGHVSKLYAKSFGAYTINAMQKILKKKEKYTFKSPGYIHDLEKVVTNLLSKDLTELEKELNAYYQQFNPVDGCINYECAMYCCLKETISPVIEALILVDRLLYLRQQPQIEKAELLRVFHPSVSPRSVLITATKKKKI